MKHVALNRAKWKKDFMYPTQLDSLVIQMNFYSLLCKFINSDHSLTPKVEDHVDKIHIASLPNFLEVSSCLTQQRVNQTFEVWLIESFLFFEK